MRTFWDLLRQSVSDSWAICKIEAHALPLTGATAANGQVRTLWPDYDNPWVTDIKAHTLPLAGAEVTPMDTCLMTVCVSTQTATRYISTVTATIPTFPQHT